MTPSAASRSLIRLASRWEAIITARRSSASTLSRSAEWARGTTSAWPRVAGAMSRKATVRSSSSTILEGSSPARILQKMQSGSLIGTDYCDRGRSRARALANASACARVLTSPAY